MKVYAGRNGKPRIGGGRALPSVEGLVVNPEISEYNAERKNLVSKFRIKGVEPLFIFEPPNAEISGNVRVHYQLTFFDSFVRAVCIEFLDTQSGILGKDFYKMGYRIE